MDKRVTKQTEMASADIFEQIFEQLDQIILGKSRQTRLSIACLLADGHLLIEDVPGLGKTVLAHALAHTLGLEYKRIQFTSDLLPGDVIGTSIYHRESASFHFTEGPVFTQLLLADEVNRATPKAQSALLEAMEERQVSVEGTSRKLPEPFFVIATQNPQEQLGTFPLPESQLDRFLLRINMGYANKESEMTLLKGEDRRQMLQHISPVLHPALLIDLQQRVAQIHASDAVLDYLYRLLAFTRESGIYRTGLSTRAGLGLLRVARAWALLHGEDKLLPGDIQAVLPSLVGHRLQALEKQMTAEQIGEQLLTSVAVD